MGHERLRAVRGVAAGSYPPYGSRRGVVTAARVRPAIRSIAAAGSHPPCGSSRCAWRAIRFIAAAGSHPLRRSRARSPAINETLPGYECTRWLALFAPAKTPAKVHQAIATSAARAIRNDQVRECLRAEGLYAYSGSAEDFAQFFRADLPNWVKVVRG